MTALILISVLGTVIIVLTIRLLVQSRSLRHSPIVTLQDYAAARETLESVFVETAAINRILSVEDTQFITRFGTPDVQRLFFKERKKLALHWFRKTRKEVGQLMDLHLRLASYTLDPSPRFELMLTAKYLGFVVVSNIGSVVLWLFGPAKLTQISSYCIRLAADFCTTFSIRLKRVNPTRLRSSLVH